MEELWSYRFTAIRRMNGILIEVESWQTGVIPPPPTEYIVDESLPEGTVTWWTDACYGYTAEGEKVFYKNGQEVKREPIDSSYYMEGAAVYKIGPNTDPNAPSQNGGGTNRRIVPRLRQEIPVVIPRLPSLRHRLHLKSRSPTRRQNQRIILQEKLTQKRQFQENDRREY